MKRVWAFLIIVALALSASGGGVRAASRPSALDGRLGGDQKSFEAQYGANGGQNEVIHGLDYAIEGFGSATVLYRSDTVISVTLTANRVQHLPLNEADDMDWSGETADATAFQFAPKDVKSNKKRLDTGDGRQEVACSSSTVAKAFSAAAWKKLKLGGKPGECHYLLSPDSAGNIYQIEIGLGRAGSLDKPQPTPSPTPRATSTPKPTVDDIKASYPPLADVRELAIRPGGMIGDKIIFSGSILTIHVAPAGYVERLGDSDPVGYAAQIQVTVAAPDGSTEVVMVGFDEDTTGMFEGSWVTVYGKVVDTATGTNLFGGTISQPLVSAQFIDLG